MLIRDRIKNILNSIPFLLIVYRLTAVIFIVVFLITIGFGCKAIEVPEEMEIYLNAWQSGDYDRMCSYIEESENDWVSSIRAFAIPIKSIRIKEAKLEDGDIVVSYSVELPDLGSIVGAVGVTLDLTHYLFTEEIERICIDQVDSASMAAGCGTWRTWEDTLRLVNTKNGYRIRTSIDRAKPSNRIAFFIRSVGAYITAFNLTHPNLNFEDHINFLFSSYTATLSMDLDNKSKLEELYSKIISQLDEFLRSLKSSIVKKWKLYSDIKYGYSIEYPLDWTLETTNSDVLIKSPNNQKYASVAISITDEINEFMDLALYTTLLEMEQDDCITVSLRKVTYQGRNGSELVRLCVSSGGKRYRVQDLFLLGSNHTYNLKSFVSTLNYADLCWTLDLILSSFQLVEFSPDLSSP